MKRAAILLSVLVLVGFVAAGLVPIDAPIPPSGVAGAPHRALSEAEQARFLRGRLLFDRDFGHDAGVGPHFNGDSCRACHQDPVVGGAGGIDVQVQRPAIPDGNGGFMPPPETGALAHTHHRIDVDREEIPAGVAFVEERNSPTLLGLGLVEMISDATILANEDPDDLDLDGIRGVAHRLPGNVIGRLGWKASVPDLASFVRDAMSNEIGITVPAGANPFGFSTDTDGIADPEINQTDLGDIVFFLQLLDFPPKGAETDQTRTGEALFASVGCAKCHVPTMDGIELYSNLLLHDVQPPGFQGVTEGEATSGLYRTPPLRGLRDTAPYFHDGRSETILDAIVRHDGEARAVRQAFQALDAAQREALLAFLRSR
ncbi:MAG: di-heme oxidoredictase family protein [Planctomycetota bacterium]